LTRLPIRLPRPRARRLLAGADALATRISQWQEVAAAAASVEHTGDTARLVLPPSPGTIAAAAALCAAETACCAQAQFLLEVTARQVILTIKTPPGDGLLQMLLPDDALIHR
jgi:hypothetical protein